MPVKSKKIDRYEKRFGLVAFERGFITAEQLVSAIAIQVQEDIEMGSHRLVGKIFVDQNIMSVKQIGEVLKYM